MLGEDRRTRFTAQGLLAAVLNAAALHDVDCLAADERLRIAVKTGALDVDARALLDDCRQAFTGLFAVVQPAAGSRVEELALFAAELIATGAIASLDHQGLEAFLRPIFDEAGIAHRFVLRLGAEDDPGPTFSTRTTPVDLVPVVLASEALFDHLLSRRETISYRSAYRAMLGPTDDPRWSLRHVPMVLQVARETGTRAVGNMNIRLESLIVNNKTRRPASGRMRDGHYAEAWIEHFGGWMACEHTLADVRAERSPETQTSEVTGTAVSEIGLIHPAPPDAAADEGTTRPDHDQDASLAGRHVDAVDRSGHPETDEKAPGIRYEFPTDTMASPGVEDSGSPSSANGDDGVGEPPSGEAPIAETAPSDAKLANPEDEAMQLPSITRSPPRVVPTPELDDDVGELPGRGVRVHRALGLAVACAAALTVALLIVVGSSVASRVAQSRGSDAEAQVPVRLALTDRFETLTVGSDPGWDTSGPGALASVVRVAPWPTAIDRSVRVKAGVADRSFAACHGIPALRTGGLLAEARIFLDGSGTSDTTIASIRSVGDEVAGLRIGPGGEILGLNDTGSRDAAATILPNVWYDVSFDLDIATRTYRLAVSRTDPPTAVSDRGGRWTTPLGGGIDRICFAPPGGVAERSIFINEVRVTAP